MKKIFKNAAIACLQYRIDHWIEHQKGCSGLNMKCMCVCMCGAYFVCVHSVCGVYFVFVWCVYILCVCGVYFVCVVCIFCVCVWYM